MYKKISEMPKEWPLPRKGKKYVLQSSHEQRGSIPVSVVLRDILKVCKTKKEVRKVCLKDLVKVNQKVRKDANYPIQLRDILTLENKNYILLRKGKRLSIEEIEDKKAKTKIVKIVGKRILSNGRIQANMEDGTNILTKEKFNCGDSFVLDLEKNLGMKVISLKEKSKVEVVKGKHGGKIGVVKEINEKNNKKIYLIKFGEGEVEIPKKNLLAIE
jgi:small subunit ribosomal protein S4e